MNRSAKAFAVFLSLAVVGHALAQSATAEMVCRFSGKVMTVNCPCPEDEEQGATLEKSGCCEIRQADPEAVPDSTPGGAQSPVPLVFVVAPARESVLATNEGTDAPPDALGQAPPTHRLYERLRHLLL